MNTNFLHDIRNLDNDIIEQNVVSIKDHLYLVSTIFLNFNINNKFSNTPLYYETKIFSMGKEIIYYSDPMFLLRYSSNDEALLNHKNIINSLNEGSLKMVHGYFEFE